MLFIAERTKSINGLDCVNVHSWSCFHVDRLNAIFTKRGRKAQTICLPSPKIIPLFVVCFFSHIFSLNIVGKIKIAYMV